MRMTAERKAAEKRTERRKGTKRPDREAAQRERKKPDGDAGEMSVSGHLKELRRRILICLICLAVTMTAGLGYVREIVRFLLRLGERYEYQFVYISPQELLLEYFSVDVICSVCLVLPVLLYELWAFLRPGLRRRERLLYLLSMVFGLLFAGLGILFAYYILIPFMLYFLISLSEGSGVRPAVTVQNYISFLLTVFLIFAAVFELPVVSVLLTQLGIVKVEWLKRFRKAAVVVIFLVAALITPPDVVSQILVAVPLLGLYQLSIFLCVLAARLRPPREEPEGEAEAET